MNKSLLILLSVISLSLTGMEQDQQRSQLKQSDSNTWVLQPLGGYIQLHQYCKDELRNFYNDQTVEKSIHYTPVSNDIHNPIYKFLKWGMRPAVPLNLFTEEGKSYTMTHGNNEFTIVSDQVYDEKRFDTKEEYWKNIHTKKYSYDEYMKKIRNNK